MFSSKLRCCFGSLVLKLLQTPAGKMLLTSLLRGIRIESSKCFIFTLVMQSLHLPYRTSQYYYHQEDSLFKATMKSWQTSYAEYIDKSVVSWG